VAEEGSLVIQSEEEYNEFNKKLTEARKKPDNKIGEGGQLIELKNPKEY
jgi:tetrahydromethanopterin S-methyltransferase subunit G